VQVGEVTVEEMTVVEEVIGVEVGVGDV